MKAERWVVDTNVLISALLQPSGRTAEVLDALRAAGGVLVFSDETFAELASRRPAVAAVDCRVKPGQARQ
jgi:predicted nucleic acid-binding protein